VQAARVGVPLVKAREVAARLSRGAVAAVGSVPVATARLAAVSQDGKRAAVERAVVPLRHVVANVSTTANVMETDEPDKARGDDGHECDVEEPNGRSEWEADGYEGDAPPPDIDTLSPDEWTQLLQDDGTYRASNEVRTRTHWHTTHTHTDAV
jgi:hypothetical protein